MKNVLLKFAGLFVERVPVDERGAPLPPGPKGAPSLGSAPRPGPMQAPPPVMPGQGQALHGMPMAPGPAGVPMMPRAGAPIPAGAAMGAPVAVALRAWVPQDYAAHLAPFGLHVIAAGGSVTSEQAIGWGAHVLVVSAECLGQDLHLLQQPQLPTVLITPQPVMIPDVPGVLQVQEPLRASDVAQAVREAAAAFGTRR